MKAVNSVRWAYTYDFRSTLLVVTSRNTATLQYLQLLSRNGAQHTGPQHQQRRTQLSAVPSYAMQTRREAIGYKNAGKKLVYNITPPTWRVDSRTCIGWFLLRLLDWESSFRHRWPCTGWIQPDDSLPWWSPWGTRPLSSPLSPATRPKEKNDKNDYCMNSFLTMSSYKYETGRDGRSQFWKRSFVHFRSSPPLEGISFHRNVESCNLQTNERIQKGSNDPFYTSPIHYLWLHEVQVFVDADDDFLGWRGGGIHALQTVHDARSRRFQVAQSFLQCSSSFFGNKDARHSAQYSRPRALQQSAYKAIWSTNNHHKSRNLSIPIKFHLRKLSRI